MLIKYFRLTIRRLVKRVREKSRECHNHKPQPIPDTKWKRKQTKPNKRKSNHVRKALRLALSSPSEVIAMLKGLKKKNKNKITEQDLKQIAS